MLTAKQVKEKQVKIVLEKPFKEKEFIDAFVLDVKQTFRGTYDEVQAEIEKETIKAKEFFKEYKAKVAKRRTMEKEQEMSCLEDEFLSGLPTYLQEKIMEKAKKKDDIKEFLKTTEEVIKILEDAGLVKFSSY